MKSKERKRNTPIATLIKNYINKKSGKVPESRKEIQRRFDHLDWKDQKKIMQAFLESGKADRLWAYITSLQNSYLKISISLPMIEIITELSQVNIHSSSD